MPAALATTRDREILRSFSRRIDPSDAGAYNNLGVLYYHKGMHEEAVAAFTRALELDSRMQVAQRNLEIAFFSTGYYDRRVAELRERLATTPDDREARWELGRAYASLGQVREAMVEFEALLERHPDDVAAIVQLALALKTNGEIEDAQRWFERALSIEPDSPVVNFYLGEVFYNRGLSENALELLKRAIELSPESPDAHYLLAFVLGDLGMHEEAREATRRAVQLNPSLSRAQANLTLERFGPAAYEAVTGERRRRQEEQKVEAEDRHLAHFNLGLAFRRKGYYAEALREYRCALDRGEDRTPVLQAMAEVHLLRHDHEAALELYERLVTQLPDSPKVWSERGVALHQAGRAGEAADSYRRALEADGSYALAHNNLGVALFHAGDPKGALVAFRAALGARPRFTKAWLNLALLLYRGRRFPLALEAYRQVQGMEPEQPVAWNGIGLVLAELRKFDDARNAFARAIQAREDFAEAHYNLSFTLSNLGDYDGALRATKRALELDPYYVPQRFELAMDVEHEEPELTLPPEFDGARRVDAGIEAFSFDPDLLDSLFGDLRLSSVDNASTEPVEASPFALARDCLGKGLLDRAAAEVSRALARGAPRLEGLVILGDVFARQGLHGEALERFREARSLNGVSPRALRGETRSLVALGRAGEAGEPVESLLAHDSDDVETLLLAATVYANGGDPARARDLLASARRLAPARADVLKQIGDVARAVSDEDAAITAYRHALELDQDFAVVHFELARLLAARNDTQGAEQSLLAALDAVPTYAAAALELAVLRRSTGRAALALPPLVELLKRDSTNLDALLLLAESLLDLDRQEDAVVAAGRILRFDPDHAGALYVQGRVLADRKRYHDAIEYWQRAIEVEPDGPYARRARRDARTAADLIRIFRQPEAD